MVKSSRTWDAASPEDRRIAHACKAAVRSILPDADVVLYGSRARGDAGAKSDFDLLSIVAGPVSPAACQAVSDAIYEVELERGIVVSCLVCSREQWDAPPWRAAPLREIIEREGIAL